jgi:hypothetical protein
MKSDRFSEFDSIKVSDTLKQKIMQQIDSVSNVNPKSKRRIRLVVSTACLALVIITGSIITLQISDKTISSSDSIRTVSNHSNVPLTGIKIITNQPNISSTGSKSVGSMAALPSEDELYTFANTIFYGRAEGFKWVVLENEKDSFFRYRTIVSVKILNNYKGDIQMGKTIDILLPISISGTGSGSGVEDNENASKLSKGSKAFFFVKKFNNEDTIMNGSTTIKTRDICSYGTGWGNQYILPNENGKFNYIFTSSQELSFNAMEDTIKNKVK